MAISEALRKKTKVVIGMALSASVAVFVLLGPYERHCYYLDGSQHCSPSNLEELGRYFYYLQNPVKTGEMSDPSCSHDLDAQRSGLLNGTYTLDYWVCPGDLLSYSLDASSKATLTSDCYELYESRKNQVEESNDLACELLGVEQCTAKVIIDFEEFYEKYCAT